MNVKFRLFGKLIEINISNWADDRLMRKEWHKNGIWVTKEGQKIPIAKMSTSHLMNVWRLLNKKAKDLSRSIYAYPEPQGEMAQEAYWQACNFEDANGKPTQKEILEGFAIYPHIHKELIKRAAIGQLEEYM